MGRTRRLAMIIVTLTGLAALTGGGGGGCQATQSAQSGPLVRWNRGGDFPRVILADQDGEYALFAEGSKEPRAAYFVRKDQALGFEVYDTEIVAVAGENRVEVPNTANYYWARR